MTFPQLCSALDPLTFSLLPSAQGGFPAMINGWRWPIYELLWTSGFALLTLPFLLPETLGDTILQRRAERLRRLTGNPLIKTCHELEQPADETIISVGVQDCRHAFRLLFEPAILFANSYTALCYM